MYCYVVILFCSVVCDIRNLRSSLVVVCLVVTVSSESKRSPRTDFAAILYLFIHVYLLKVNQIPEKGSNILKFEYKSNFVLASHGAVRDVSCCCLQTTAGTWSEQRAHTASWSRQPFLPPGLSRTSNQN